jgi:hypothetical protein
MTSTWLDDLDVEGAEYDDTDAAEYDDSDAGELAESDYDTDYEGDYDAESRASRRRAQRRRVAAARRRQAVVRARAQTRRGAGGRPARPTSTASAIRNLDLNTKVADDNFRRALGAQAKRMSRSEYAAVAGAAVTQAMASFGTPSNPYVAAAVRFSPLLLLSPQRRGTGVEAFAKDPRVLGAAAVAGITVIGQNRERFTRAREIEILAPTGMGQSASDTFVADVKDGRGVVISDMDVEWESSDPTVAAIDRRTGAVTTQKATGTTIITARTDGIVRRVRLTVT